MVFRILVYNKLYIMKPRFLLSHSFKRIGWVVFVPALLFGILVQHQEYEIPGFAVALDDPGITVSGKPLKTT